MLDLTLIRNDPEGGRAARSKRMDRSGLDPAAVKRSRARVCPHCFFKVVAPAGIEPARPKASDFKSLASTSSAKGPASRGVLIPQPVHSPKRGAPKLKFGKHLLELYNYVIITKYAACE